MKRLSDVELMTCWMSVRYSIGRQTIATASLPELLVKNYFERFTEDEKKGLIADIRRHFEIDGWTANSIDSKIWLKFAAALDTDKHYDVQTVDGKTHTVFSSNNRIYPLKEYVKNPHIETFIGCEYEELCEHK